MTKIITNVIQIFIENIWKPDPVKDRYSIGVLIPKTDQVTVDEIDKAISTELVLKWPNKMLPDNFNGHPKKDGDELYLIGYPYYFKGMYVLNAWSKQPPGIVDRYKKPVAFMSIRSGDYIKVQIAFYSYQYKEVSGVGACLHNIMYIKKGSLNLKDLVRSEQSGFYFP